MSTIVGMAGFGRSSVALVRDGVALAVVAEESLTRRKADPAIPEQAFQFVCQQAGLPPSAIDYVVFAEKPVQRFVRILGGLATGFPHTLVDFPSTLTTWLGDRLWLRSTLVRRLLIDPDRLLFVERSLAQVASAFSASGHDRAAIVIADGYAEWAAMTLARGEMRDGRMVLEVLAEIQYPHALTFLLTAVARHLSIAETGGVRWLAPLSALGKPRFVDALRAIVRSEPDGAYSLDTRALQVRGCSASFARRAYATLGEPRGPGEALLGEAADARFVDLARSAQAVVVEHMLAVLHAAKTRCGVDTLCLGGALFQHPGVVANVVASAPFAQIFVDPLTDEAGAALGAARYVEQAVLGGARTAAGSAWPLLPLPADAHTTTTTLAPGERVARAAAALVAGKVVGWVTGLPEADGRPHGQCVVLADPAQAGAIARLRRQVKLAEDYVPLAALAPRDLVAQWTPPVLLDAVARGLAVTKLPAALAAKIPGVVHRDGSVLLSAVDAAGAPELVALLQAFGRDRPPVLAQSSLNRAGEPPVLKPGDALDLLRRTAMDVLFWGDHEVMRS